MGAVSLIRVCSTIHILILAALVTEMPFVQFLICLPSNGLNIADKDAYWIQFYFTFIRTIMGRMTPLLSFDVVCMDLPDNRKKLT